MLQCKSTNCGRGESGQPRKRAKPSVAQCIESSDATSAPSSADGVPGAPCRPMGAARGFCLRNRSSAAALTRRTQGGEGVPEPCAPDDGRAGLCVKQPRQQGERWSAPDIRITVPPDTLPPKPTSPLSGGPEPRPPLDLAGGVSLARTSGRRRGSVAIDCMEPRWGELVTAASEAACCGLLSGTVKIYGTTPSIAVFWTNGCTVGGAQRSARRPKGKIMR
jgi:hypothetical protein